MKRIFLSFSSKDVVIADVVEEKIIGILGNQISISRYERQVGVFESFKEFMNSLGEHDYVLIIVSDAYLKSDACLYEMGEVLKMSRFKDKLLFVVIKKEDKKYVDLESYDDGNFEADIYSFEGRVRYLHYWQERDLKELESLGTLNDIIKRKEFDEYAIRNKIRLYDLPEFLNYLSDTKGLSLTELIKVDFKPIVSRMLPEYIDDLYKYNNLVDILYDYIHKISDCTGTDYNQIILKAKTSSHSEGLIVVADKISANKQHYRIVVNGGIISNAVDMNRKMIVDNTEESDIYFRAVIETKSEIVIPMSYNGRVIGAINSESYLVGYYNPDTLYKLGQIADRMATLLINRGYWLDKMIDELPYVSVAV